MQRTLKSLLLATAFGLLFGTVFFLLSVSAIFMVGGGGEAPVFTHVMLTLIEAPYKLFNIPIPRQGSVGEASYFYALVAMVAFFIYLVARKIEP